jgi:trigger factor
MEATTAQANELERRVDLSIAIADVEKEMEQRLKRMGKNIKMPDSVRARSRSASSSSSMATRPATKCCPKNSTASSAKPSPTQKMRVAGYPRIEPKTTESTTHLEFSAIFEVYPEFTPGDMSTAEIERPVLEVSAAEVDKTLDILRKQRVSYEDADRAAAKEDRVVIDFLGKKDGVPFQGGQAKDYPFVLGQGMMLPDFENAVEGAKPANPRPST